MVVAKDAPHPEARVNSRSEAAPDYYEVLQVSRNAHPLIVAKAYRLLAAFYHPDSPETGSKDHFLEVVEAYRVLSDPVRRAMYDRRLFGAARAPRDESGGEALRSAGGPNRGVEDRAIPVSRSRRSPSFWAVLSSRCSSRSGIFAARS